MRQRFLVSLALFVLVAAAIAFLLLTEAETETETETLISDLDKDTISTITIQHKDNESIVFQRDDSHWLMQSPFTVAAKTERIDALLNLLSSGSAAQLDVNTTDLQRLLLAEPEVSVQFDEHLFQFGDINPLDKKRYVLFNDTVHLVHDNLYPQLTVGPTFFIDHNLFRPDEKIISVQYPQFRLLNEQDQWRLESELNVDDEQVQLLGRTWATLNANTVQQYEPLEPLYELHVTLTDGRAITFAVISDLPELVLARADLGLQYHIPAYLSEKLFPRESAEESVSE